MDPAGGRWKDSSGAPTCNFPPYSLINSLPEAVRPAFDAKAITHSYEYYQVDGSLLRRIDCDSPFLPSSCVLTLVFTRSRLHQAFIDILLPKLKRWPGEQHDAAEGSPRTPHANGPQPVSETAIISPIRQHQRNSGAPVSPLGHMHMSEGSAMGLRDFQSELAALRREMSAEVAALGRNVGEQLASIVGGLHAVQGQVQAVQGQLQAGQMQLAQSMQALQLSLLDQVSRMSTSSAAEMQQVHSLS